jgi:hypothetical protein
MHIDFSNKSELIQLKKYLDRCQCIISRLPAYHTFSHLMKDIFTFFCIICCRYYLKY